MSTNWTERHELVFREIATLFKKQGCSTIVINPGSRIDTAIKSVPGLWEEIDIQDLYSDIDELFGLQSTTKIWAPFHGKNHTSASWESFANQGFHFRDLTNFILKRLDQIQVVPVRILGKPCAAAGAFRSICKIVEELVPSAKPFGPSTPIREILKGQNLVLSWRRFDWISEVPLPPLRTTVRTYVATLMGWMVIIFALFGFIALLALNSWWWFNFTMFSLPLVVLLWYAIVKSDNQLPIGLATFKDLATAVAA